MQGHALHQLFPWGVASFHNDRPKDFWDYIEELKHMIDRTINAPSCWTSLNEPSFHAFCKIALMDHWRLSSSLASFGERGTSLLSPTVILQSREGKSGSSLCLQKALNTFIRFVSSGLWSSSMKRSQSHDTQISIEVSSLNIPSCGEFRSPTDKWAKSSGKELVGSMVALKEHRFNIMW